ncbi:MAG: NAD-dependent epimerase/dehydratase family protein [Nitriliruptoraceae bacterium]
MTVVAITGASSVLGPRLLRRVASASDITRIIAIDRSPPLGVTVTGCSFHEADPGTADLRAVLAGVDVVVHLGATLEPTRDDALVRRREVDAAKRVAEAAAEAGVGHLVVTSSVLAYGAHPDNEVPLTEDRPIRGLSGLPAAEHAAEVEHWLERFRAAHPEVTVTTLRLALLAGPDVDTLLTRALEAPRIPAVRGHRPPLQFLHPDDAVDAIVHAIAHRLAGAYNVCADGWLSFDEVTAILGRPALEVPEEVAYSGAAGVYALRLGDLSPGLVSLFVHPCVMSNDALTATGWRPRASNRDAVAALAVEHGRYLTLGRVRATRATVAVSALVGTALGSVALWQLARLARRRWQRRRARR